MNEKSSIRMLVSFLLGIFMGAIDSGIVSPAREIIQNSFNVASNAGMWMITLYTLTFAVSMPIVSKLADRYGRKRVYTYSIVLFALGSLLCGVSNLIGGYGMMLVARVVQAIGAGGITPIATAVIGQSFPEEKRGMALGLVGAIYGVATIIGPTIGSGILSLAGNDHWGWIFLINLPISMIIILLSSTVPNQQGDRSRPLDLAGGAVIALTVGSLMYALTNLDLFHLATSIRQLDVYPFLLAFVLLIPLLVWIEQRAEDPVINLKYFRSRQIVTILILAFIVGTGMMGMIFVPQFAENVLKIKAGTGGYIVTLLAIFSGIASPLSGRLIDKRGARFVLMMGFMFTIAGTLTMGFFAVHQLTFLSVLVGLALMGFGVGFTMGAPLNYLILEAVSESEGATALATMSLVRAIGVAVSPSLMIGFIVRAAGNLQTELMTIFQNGLASMMPGGGAMPMNMGANPEAARAFAGLQSASVVDVVDRLKDIFTQMIPAPFNNLVVQGVEGMRSTIESVFQTTLNAGYTHMFTAAALIAGIGFVTSCILQNQKNRSPKSSGLTLERSEGEV